ncbi:MAG TPA: hypothetical protein PK095_02935 [Myxococcota bacterium]|nr:hypothetical protein [Myxococcota bacterium]
MPQLIDAAISRTVVTVAVKQLSSSATVAVQPSSRVVSHSTAGEVVNSSSEAMHSLAAWLQACELPPEKASAKL